MIPLQRPAAPPPTKKLLATWTTRVQAAGATPKAAREQWKNAVAPKKHIRRMLEPMASGVVRCMYCEDNLGTDIDHFQPIAHAPLRAFDWPNHLLACSHCNSNKKRDAYPLDAHGHRLLVDPSTDDPADHLTLLLASGTYMPLTPQGTATIEVFGLNRPGLVTGRQTAFVTTRATLLAWHASEQTGDHRWAHDHHRALHNISYAAVLRAIIGLSPPQARQVLASREAAAAAAAWRTHRHP